MPRGEFGSRGNSSPATPSTFADLIEGKQPVSLYLVVPPSDISRTKPLVRLVLNQIGCRLTEQLHAEGDARPRKLLLMLDEFPALGDRFPRFAASLTGVGKGDDWPWSDVEGSGGSAITVAEPPELCARWLNDEGKPLPSGKSEWLRLRFGSSDLELGQHHRVPEFSGPTQQTHFVYFLLESTDQPVRLPARIDEILL